MKVEVTRERTDGELVFTIRCTEPHEIRFNEKDCHIMEIVDKCRDEVGAIDLPEGSQLKTDLYAGIHDLKDMTWQKIKTDLIRELEDKFGLFFEAIRYEAYNWIYDNQRGKVKEWMRDFDCERTKYYFDNDEKKFN